MIKKKEFQEYLAALKEYFVTPLKGIFKKEVFDYISQKDSSIPLQSARETIQALGKKIRDAQTGSVTGESVDVGKLKLLESAFKKQIKKNAKIILFIKCKFLFLNVS